MRFTEVYEPWLPEEIERGEQALHVPCTHVLQNIRTRPLQRSREATDELTTLISIGLHAGNTASPPLPPMALHRTLSSPTESSLR